MKTIYVLFALLSLSLHAQESLDDVLKRHNNNGVPYISVEELAMPKTNAIILDAREPQEYQVSHLKDAIYVGYDEFKLKNLTEHILNKNEPIVVYCSLGIRSEVIANQLKKAGYTDVKNLYGGIFEWKNKDFEVYNSAGKKTDSVHTFSKTWSKWLINGTKVYPKVIKK